MATTTTRLSLRKPAGSDNVNVTTDISDNMDKVDAAVGFEAKTSFPASPYQGQTIFRTDGNDVAWFYTGSVWQALQHQMLGAIKTVDQTVNNSAVLVDDTELQLPTMVANKLYVVDLFIFYSSITATPDLKFGFSVPSGATLKWMPGGLLNTGTTTSGSILMSSNTTGTAVVATVAGTEVAARASGLLVMGGNAGTLKLQFAQNTATAENTIVKPFSTLIAHRI